MPVNRKYCRDEKKKTFNWSKVTYYVTFDQWNVFIFILRATWGLQYSFNRLLPTHYSFKCNLVPRAFGIILIFFFCKDDDSRLYRKKKSKRYQMPWVRGCFKWWFYHIDGQIISDIANKKTSKKDKKRWRQV